METDAGNPKWRAHRGQTRSALVNYSTTCLLPNQKIRTGKIHLVQGPYFLWWYKGRPGLLKKESSHFKSVSSSPFCLNPLSFFKCFFLRIQLYDLLAPPACNQGDVGCHWIIDWQLKNGEDFPNFVLLCCHSNEDELVRFLLRCIKVTETDWQLKVWLCVLHASFHTQNDWLHIKMTVAASIYARQSWHSEIGDWR